MGTRAVSVVAAVLLLLVTSAVSLAQVNTTVGVATSPTYGLYLTTPSGLPLYTYSGDSPGTSNVTGSLLAAWPAFTASGSLTLPTDVGGTLSQITRPDGSQQVAYNGLPLYTFVQDSPGNVTGQGVAGFKLATVSVYAATSTPAAATPAPAGSGTTTRSEAPAPTATGGPDAVATALLLGSGGLFILAGGYLLRRRR